MKKSNVIGAMLLVCSICIVNASEQPVQPIGYFVETISDSDVDQTQSHAKFTRDGEVYDAVAGMPVFPGDIVSTPANGGILVAFVDNNTLQLQGDTTTTLNSLAGLATNNASQFTVNVGHAIVTARSLGENGLNIDIGATKKPLARAAAPVPGSLDIVVTKDPNGNYISNVACLKGSALLTPTNGGAPVNISSLGFAMLTVNMQTNPPSGTVSAGNIDKATLAGLKANSVAETFVKMSKTAVTFTSTIKNPDGSLTKGTLTTNLNGQVTKDSWKTTGSGGLKESWTETPGTGKIAVSETFNGITFKATFPGGKASIHDALNKQTYTGTAIYDPVTGIITFTTSKSGKDGSTATYTYNPYAPGGATMAVSVTGGTGAGITSRTVVNGAPLDQTPDGRVINQNQPPKSQ